MIPELQNMQVWKSNSSDRIVERTIIDIYINRNNVRTIQYTNIGSNVKYKIHESEFIKWIAMNKATINIFAKLSSKAEVEQTLLKKAENFDEPIKPLDTYYVTWPHEREKPKLKPIKSIIESALTFPMFKTNERTSVYFDAQNLNSTIYNLGYQFDYRKFFDFMNEHTSLIRCHYYVALKDNSDYKPIKILLDWLEFNNYNINRRIVASENEKTNIDSDLIVDVMMHAFKSRLDHVVLFSGDGDFTKMVKAVQELGIKVTVVSTAKPGMATCATILRRQSDYYLDLDDLRTMFAYNGNMFPINKEQ